MECEAGGTVAGVDEVGRGPLAGPVVAAAVVFLSPPPDSLSILIDDSKRLTASQREVAAASLRASPLASLAVAAASATEIDRLNVLGASLLAMRRAVLRLPCPPTLVLVDGNRPPVLPIPSRCVVGGDGVSLSIAAASILAKVVRDRAMERLARRWPGYGWERNAGYPTAEHRAALSRLGVTPHHRRSFGPVRAAGLPSRRTGEAVGPRT